MAHPSSFSALTHPWPLTADMTVLEASPSVWGWGVGLLGGRIKCLLGNLFQPLENHRMLWGHQEACWWTCVADLGLMWDVSLSCHGAWGKSVPYSRNFSILLYRLWIGVQSLPRWGVLKLSKAMDGDTGTAHFLDARFATLEMTTLFCCSHAHFENPDLSASHPGHQVLVYNL